MAICAFALLAGFFYAKTWDGYVLRQGDTVNYLGMSKEARDYHALTGNWSGWTGSMFGGMPTDQITGSADNISFAKSIKTAVIKMTGGMPAGVLVLAMLSAYLLAISLGATPLMAALAGIAFGLSSIHILYLGAGHNSKVAAIALLPGVVAGVVWFFRRNAFIGAAMASLFTGMILAAGHPQMTYYILFLLGAVGLTELWGQWKEGVAWKELLKKTGWIFLAGLLGALPFAQSLSETKAYSHFTTRGERILEANAEVETKGLDSDYILQYSMSEGEWWSVMCPNIKGGADPLYWGEQHFSGGAFYFGAVVCFFFLIFLLVGRDRLKWPLLLVSLLSILLSWRGSTFVMDFFLEHIPFYNQFRDTKMMLVLLQVSVGMGMVLAFQELIQLGKRAQSGDLGAIKQRKLWFIAGGGIVLLFGAFYALPEVFFSFQSEIRSDRVVEQVGSREALNLRLAIFRPDVLRTLGLLALAFLGMAALLFEWTKSQWVLLGLGAVMVGDLWMVDRRYSNDDKSEGQHRYWVKSVDAKFPFVPSPQMQRVFQMESHQSATLSADAAILLTSYENQLDGIRLKRNERMHLESVAQFGALRLSHPVRVLQWGNPFNDAKAAYFFQSVGGYHGAKLRRYQDFIERVLTPEHEGFVEAAQRNQIGLGLMAMVGHRMLNTQYMLVDQMESPLAIPEPSGAAWAVSNWRIADTDEAEIRETASLTDIDVAVVHAEFESVLEELVPGGAGVIERTSYSPDWISYQANLESEALVLFSEIWYPNGWTAAIDGKPVRAIRANYVLRGLRVPAGAHTIDWSFASPSHTVRSVGINLVFILFILLMGFLSWRFRKA